MSGGRTVSFGPFHNRRTPPPVARGETGGLRTDLDGALGDHGAVGFIDNAVDLLEVVRVRDDLVVAENILEAGRVLAHLLLCLLAPTLRLMCNSFSKNSFAHLEDNHLEVWSVVSREIGQRLSRQGGAKEGGLSSYVGKNWSGARGRGGVAGQLFRPKGGPTPTVRM